MKKTKLLIGTLVLSMGLMGTGYAYWTKQLTVNTTVSSANFDVYFSEQSATKTAISEAINNTHNTLTSDIKDSKTKQSQSTGDLVEYAWDNIYPGSQVTLSYTITSTSTIPVKAQPVYTLDQDSDATLAGALDFTVGSTTYHGFAAFAAAMQANLLELDKASVTAPISKQITVVVTLDKAVKDIKTINNSFGFNVGMLWKQFNDNTVDQGNNQGGNNGNNQGGNNGNNQGGNNGNNQGGNNGNNQGGNNGNNQGGNNGN